LLDQDGAKALLVRAPPAKPRRSIYPATDAAGRLARPLSLLDQRQEGEISMEPVTLIGGAIAAAAAGLGLRVGSGLLPIALEAQREVGEYGHSEGTLRERRFARSREKHQILANPEGSDGETSILGLAGSTVRHRDGSFSRFYEVALQETMLAAGSAAEGFC